MLSFTVKSSGESHLVCYSTPGVDVPTVACVCRTESQAYQEADRLNKDQVLREKEIRWNRELRGLHGVYPELESRGI